ncbi:MAG: ECF-type sigma factor [Planctomycetota bacterium]
MPEITQILSRLSSGDSRAIEELTPLVYRQMRQIANRQLEREQDRRNWDATELVHEAYLRMIGDQPVSWKDRAHFFATAATVIRHVLVDDARKIKSQKRGGGAKRVSVIPDAFGRDTAIARDEMGFELLDLDDALCRLKDLHPRQARLVELRFFGGVTQDEAAELLGVSKRTVAGDWAMARAWLYRQLVHPDHDAPSKDSQ